MVVVTGLHSHLVFERQDFRLDVRLDIDERQTVAVLGPNGAGKSTIVSLLGGLEALSAGSISLDGIVLDDPTNDTFVAPHLRDIGIVFQDYLLFEHLNVLDNVGFGADQRVNTKATVEAEARLWVSAMGLEGLEQRHPSQLSGGQAQRVALARALLPQPAMVLLDEPLAALDVESRASARQLLAKRLERFEGPRLLITHDPTEARLLADEIVVVENGRVTQRGTPDEVRRRPATPYVASFAGTNLLAGTCRSGRITLDQHPVELSTDNTSVDGAVLAVIDPRAVALHPIQPEGSARNTWQTTVAGLEPLGDVTRVLLGGPLPLAVDITPAGAAALELRPGSEVWAAVKATEVNVEPA